MGLCPPVAGARDGGTKKSLDGRRHDAFVSGQMANCTAMICIVDWIVIAMLQVRRIAHPEMFASTRVSPGGLPASGRGFSPSRWHKTNSNIIKTRTNQFS